MKILKILINQFLEILFPTKCIGCHKYEDILCNNCINNLKITERPTEDNIYALYDYKDPIVKDAIWKLKYHHIKYLGEKLGKLLYEGLIENIDEMKIFQQGSPIYIIPVPISNEKKENRGYNQSEVIAKSFCQSGNPNLFLYQNKIIIKNKNTIPQARLTNRNKRLQNIKGAFSIINTNIIKGKTVIIIDDVTTTGGTMLEIIKILKKSGAKKVIGFAVAH